jgi:hypothetical protein
MPFKSQAQRNLFYAAKGDPELRRAKGLTLTTVSKFTDHDTGGKLPRKVKKRRKRK